MRPAGTGLAWLALALIPAGAVAQPPGQRPPVTAGLGVVASPSPYAGVDEPDLTPVPFLGLEGDRFYLRGIEGGYRLTGKEGRFSAAAVVQPRFQSHSPGDSPALAGMDSRQRTAEGGLRGRLRAGRYHVGVRAVSDLLGRHGGQAVTADVGARLGGPRLMLSPSAGVAWHSADSVDYYYGVRPGEARPGRPAYSPGAAASPFVAGVARLRLNRRWGLFAYLRHSWLDGPITDSPIVDRTTVYSGVLAVTYAFGVGGPPGERAP